MADDKEIKGRLQQVLAEYESNPTQLAKQFKVNQKTLNNHINGSVEVSVSTLLLVLNAFPDISPDWVLFGKGDMYRLPAKMDSPEDVTIGDLEKENARLRAKIDGMLEMAKAFGLNLPDTQIKKTAVG